MSEHSQSGDCILGIDPGSRVTGFGIVQSRGAKVSYVTSGCIVLPKADMSERLNQIYQDVSELITQFSPSELAIEKVFVGKNVDSALKLGQARGAAIVACTQQGMTVAEYTPRTIKSSVVGRGNAIKSQVQHMVTAILGLPSIPKEDAADALAVAICHAQSRQSLIHSKGISTIRRGRFR